MTTHTPGNLYLLKPCVRRRRWHDGIGVAGICRRGVRKNFQISTQATIEAIVGDIFDSKDPLGLQTYVGNGLNGEVNAEWLGLNCSIPQAIDASIVPGAVGGARQQHNRWWCKRKLRVDAKRLWCHQLRCSRCRAADFCFWNAELRDHEAIQSGFFVRPPPGDQTDGINAVNAPFAKRLHDNTPSGLERICAWSNSRVFANVVSEKPDAA